MAKRYHQTKKDRHHESEGMRHHEAMERHERGGIGHEAVMRKRSEHGIDFHEDMAAPANLPREVMYKYWPKSPYHQMGMVDDLFEGVEKQMRHDNSEFGRIMDPKKY